MKPKLLKTLERENEMAIPAGLAIDLSARHAGGRGFEPVSRAPFGAGMVPKRTASAGFSCPPDDDERF
jgi:hypothetical protein